jgi:pentatricopeptide repeat protein
MQREKKKKIIAPNAVTLLCALKACAMARDVRKGEEVHKEIASKECGLLSSSEEEVTMLVNALVDMYGKCGRLGKAQRVLEEAGPMRNVVTWNALIGGYAEANRLGEAWECLERMREDDGLEPNAVTFICMLKACGQCGALEQGQHLHASIAASCSEALLKTNTHNNNNNNNDNNNDNNNNDNDNGNNTALGNAVVDMYARCGAVSRAREVLDRLPDRTLLSWSALIAGYARLGRAREAAGCLGAMRKQGLAPNAVTLASMLKALGGSTSTSTSASAGLQASGFVVDRRLLEKEIVLGNATVAMYARRGMLDEARSVADQLPAHDVVTWNALIAGLAEQGQGPPALACFERMRSDGIVPNATTFLSAIHACRRSGLSEPALALLSDMRNRYRLLPGTQHHACLVAALGDAGHLQMAASIISTVPDHDPALWLALLASCSRWGANAGLALLAFDRVLQMDRACAPAYVLIARILTASGLLDDGCRPSLQEERPSLQEERPEL